MAVTPCWWRTSWAAGRPRSTSLWSVSADGWPGNQRAGKVDSPLQDAGPAPGAASSLPTASFPSPCSHPVAVLHAH